MELRVEESARRRSGKRTLVLVGPYPPPWGGIAVHVRALQELAQRVGLPVQVLDTGADHALRDGAGGVRNAGGYTAFVRELARAAAAGSRIHAHVPGNNLKAWLVALAASRARLEGSALLTVHSGLAPAFLDGSPAAQKVARAACGGYTKVLCANGEIAAALERFGVDHGRLEVLPAFVPGGVVPGEAPVAARLARQRHDKLLVAALAPGVQYGEAVLLRALELMCRQHRGLGCIVYGPGTDEASFGARIAERGLFGRVTALGPIDHPLSLGVMRLADVFVRPTLADGDSISVREALALGVRVVASSVGHRPPEATLFRVGDPAELAARVEMSLVIAPPAPGAGGADVTNRILEAWSSIGLEPSEGARA